MTRMTPKKLLQLNVTANWGSTGKIAEEIGLAAMEKGWESTIAYGRYSNKSSSRLIKVDSKVEVYAHYAYSRFLDGEGLGSRMATKSLIEQIEEYQPDIIHLHNIHDHWLNYPILFRYLTAIQIPLVWTFHDCWAFTGHCAHFENVGCDRWVTQCVHCPQRKNFSVDYSTRNFELKRKYFGELCKRMSIVTPSFWLEEYVKKSIFKGATINTIHNGVDTKLFSPLNGVKKKRMILGVSNVWPDYKGLKDFIELRKLLPNDTDIVLVGLTPTQISNLPDGITGLTRTANVEELIKLYNEASIFVNPTRNDTFPTVNLEALSCGTPVITYQTGGSPEAIDDKTGIVVKKGDVRALSDAIKNTLEVPFDKNCCRERAENYFNKNNQFDKYIELYGKLLK